MIKINSFEFSHTKREGEILFIVIPVIILISFSGKFITFIRMSRKKPILMRRNFTETKESKIWSNDVK